MYQHSVDVNSVWLANAVPEPRTNATGSSTNCFATKDLVGNILQEQTLTLCRFQMLTIAFDKTSKSNKFLFLVIVFITLWRSFCFE